jgi:hypothetical protein
MKRFWSLLSSLILSVSFAGESLAQQSAKAELKVGFVPGPYIDEFKAGVEPKLKKKDRWRYSLSNCQDRYRSHVKPRMRRRP